MSEEVRFFLRTALYTGLIATIYWFVSYEWAGTVLLAFLFGSAIFFVVITFALVKSARPRGVAGRRGLGRAFQAIVGFEDDPSVEPPAPLEIADDRFPTRSIWPLALAVAATLVSLGLVYGPWLWIPGTSLLIASGLAWATQLR